MIVKECISDIVYDRIKTKLLNGEIKSGEKINIDELVNIFDTSKIPIREALKRLQQEDLVQYKVNVGMKVTIFNENDLYEILDILSLLTCNNYILESYTKENIEGVISECKKYTCRINNSKLKSLVEIFCNQLTIWSKKD